MAPYLSKLQNIGFTLAVMVILEEKKKKKEKFMGKEMVDGTEKIYTHEPTSGT